MVEQCPREGYQKGAPGKESIEHKTLKLKHGKRLCLQIHRSPKGSTLGDWLFISDPETASFGGKGYEVVIGAPDPESPEPERSAEVSFYFIGVDSPKLAITASGREGKRKVRFE